MSGNKLTNDEYRDLVRDFLTKGLKSNKPSDNKSRLSEQSETLSPPEIRSRTNLGPGNYNPGTDAMIMMDAIEYAITDALDEELGIRPDQLEALRDEVYRRKDLLEEAIKNGFETYERKLNMMGGSAKPRN